MTTTGTDANTDDRHCPEAIPLPAGPGVAPLPPPSPTVREVVEAIRATA